MAAKKPLGRLASGELALLEMLWRERSVTLSEALAAFDSAIGYTTVQTRLNRLVKKKLARRSSGRPARYEPAVTPEEVGAGDVKLLAERVCQGAIAPLVAHLIKDATLTPSEIAELKGILAKAEANLKRGGKPKEAT